MVLLGVVSDIGSSSRGIDGERGEGEVGEVEEKWTNGLWMRVRTLGNVRDKNNLEAIL